MQRLLILRPDNIGDVLLFSGAWQHLRRRWPAHEITLAVRRHVLNLVELCPHVDRVVAYDDLAAGVARGNVDDAHGVDPAYWRGGIAILPVRSPTAAMHALLRDVPAAEKYGIAGDCNNQTEEGDRSAAVHYTGRHAVPPEQRWRHELAVTGDFLRFLGCDLPEGEEPAVEVWTSPRDDEFAERCVPHRGGGLVVGLMPEAGHPCRFWPVENYANVVSALPAVARVVVFGAGDAARDLATLRSGLAAACPDVEVVALSGRATLRQTLACLARCDLLISTETWVLHGAVSLGVPSVGIMGGGHFGRFYPWGDPRRHRTACRTLDCYHCNWRCPYATVRCLEQIRPADVLAEALAALAAASDDATVPRPHRSRERVTSGVCTAGRQSAAGDACGVATLDAPAGGPAAVSAIQRVVGPVQDKPQETAGSEDSRRACFRRLWRDLAQTGEPVAIFGAGAQTFWLLQAVWDVPGPAVTCVLDDAAKPGQRVVGHPVVRPVAGEPPCRRILVSSDACEERLVQRCRELYGDAVEVIRLSGAPLGRGSSC